MQCRNGVVIRMEERLGRFRYGYQIEASDEGQRLRRCGHSISVLWGRVTCEEGKAERRGREG